MQGPAKKPPLGIFPFLVAATLGVFLWLIQFVFFKAPVAQAEAGGLSHSTFYFPVPSPSAIFPPVRPLSSGPLEWSACLLYPLLHRLERLG